MKDVYNWIFFFKFINYKLQSSVLLSNLQNYGLGRNLCISPKTLFSRAHQKWNTDVKPVIDETPWYENGLQIIKIMMRHAKHGQGIPAQVIRDLKCVENDLDQKKKKKIAKRRASSSLLWSFVFPLVQKCPVQHCQTSHEITFLVWCKKGDLCSLLMTVQWSNFGSFSFWSMTMPQNVCN